MIEQVKVMNDDQLQKISKYLNVKVGSGDANDELAANLVDIGSSASIISQGEAEELADKVDELQ